MRLKVHGCVGMAPDSRHPINHQPFQTLDLFTARGHRLKTMPTVQRTTLSCLLLLSALAATPAKRDPDSFKPLPPPSTKPIPDQDRADLEAGVAALTKQIDLLHSALRDKPNLLNLLPDVEIYLNAVRYPLTYNESLDPTKAKAALATGTARAKQLADGSAPWTSTSTVR